MYCIVVFPVWDRAQCTAITSTSNGDSEFGVLGTGPLALVVVLVLRYTTQPVHLAYSCSSQGLLVHQISH
jgi:hypothetical protein